MHSTLLTAGLFALGVVGAPSAAINSKRGDYSSGGQQAFSFPLPNGFPNIAQGSAALLEIEKEAHGTLPNGGLPTHISDVSATVWSLIAFNELFEVAYFSSLLNNITNNVHGYEIGTPAARNVVLNALVAVRAQEELHALGANGILQTAGRPTISPCEYVFPASDFDSAIAFASTFTDIVLGTLQNALQNFGLDGDGADFLGLVGSVIGQEGEQNGFYRTIGQIPLIPSAKPFLTASVAPFALSALMQNVVVPGSCPETLSIPTFDPLHVDTTNLSPQTTSIQFSFETTESNYNTDELSLVYISGQNVPIVEKPTNFKRHGNTIQFTAPFPFDQFQLQGLTISALTNSAGPFANASQVASATKFGPGLIEIN
ncbi:hypothetical protein BX600DRAFT_438907 [Xylariales sp. PMI_506]|nr:hypothetical protein BX600DRAFT_438907 [Xylariales sp. PMI_506]